MYQALVFALLTCGIGYPVLAQRQPVIRASSPVVDIRDGDDFQPGNWKITPQVRPDVYEVNRFKGQKRVTFYTDLDSISFTVTPGHTYDFVILLNGRDSAYTRFSTLAPPPLTPRRVCASCHPAADTIPFVFGRGDKMYLKGSINDSRPLKLMFDLGSNQVVISKAGLAKRATLTFQDAHDNQAFGGTTTVQASRTNRLLIGPLTWDAVPIVRIDRADADGIVGYPVFDGKIIEINYDRQLLIVRDSLVEPGNDYVKLPLRFKGGLPFIEATLFNGEQRYTDYFEFDTGSNGSLWLNQGFATRHNLYATTRPVGTTSTRGLGSKRIRNSTVVFPTLSLAGQELRQVPVDLEQVSAGENLQWGIFGMDVLKRFNVILDLQHDAVYLKPNTLIDQPYTRH